MIFLITWDEGFIIVGWDKGFRTLFKRLGIKDLKPLG